MMVTAKEFVLSHYPNAYSSKEKSDGQDIWIITKTYFDTPPLSKSLRSEGNAWVNAKVKIIEQGAKNV
jgi:hypothetical protein